jgi:hypothetical protein
MSLDVISEVISAKQSSRSVCGFAPLEPFANEEQWLSTAAQGHWLLGFLLAGFALRLMRYLLCFPLWEDEAMLSANLIDRNYAQLIQPLHYCQVAPTLFLWCQLAMVRLFGFNEYVLRLVPFLCGLGSLALFRHVAGRLLQGVSLIVAVGVFAVAYPMSRYAAEAKPYGCDLFICLAILTLAVEWMRRPDQSRWLWYLAALVGPAIGFSYSAIFAAGGASLAIGAMLIKPTQSVSVVESSRPRSPWVSMWFPWLLMNIALIGGFTVVLHISHQAVGEINQQTMEEVHWADTFPPMSKPISLLLWLLKSHCGAMLGYPLGGPNWGSTASALAFFAGTILMARRRPRLALLLLSPLALNFFAAALHKYPYGGHARMTLYIAPGICMLMGLGIAGGLERLNVLTTGRYNRPRLALGVVLFLLSAMGAGSLLRDITHPYKSGTTLRAREFAQWFWSTQAHDNELASCELDLGTDMSPQKRNCGWSSLYLCNQRIYSPRLSHGETVCWDAVTPERPLRCVMYRSPKEERESPSADPLAYMHWLDRMQAQYDLVGHDRMAFAALDKSDRQPISDDYVEMFKFVPKGMAAIYERQEWQLLMTGPRLASKREGNGL